MTMEQLEYFIAVVEQDTFFDAADILHISQSTLSKQIMKLEQELGIRLLDRSRRQASLTKAGEIFYEEAQTLLAQYKKALARMNHYRASLQNELRIGTLPFLNQYHLTSRLRTFSGENPDIHLSVDEVEEMDLLPRLNNGTYDMILAREHLLNPQDHQYFPVADDELVAVLPSDHPLLTARSKPDSCSGLALDEGSGATGVPGATEMPGLALADLCREPLILMNRYTAIHQLCLKLFAEAGLQPDIIRTARVESILSAVSVGEGLSLLARKNMEIFHHEQISVISLNPPVFLPVALACRRDQPITGSMHKFIRAITLPPSQSR